jgi:hypothetical protein
LRVAQGARKDLAIVGAYNGQHLIVHSVAHAL